MSDSFVLSGVIKADGSQAINTFKQVEEQGKKTDSNLSKSFSNIAKNVGSAMSTVGIAMTGVATTIATATVTMFAPFEEKVKKVSTLVSKEFEPQISKDMKALSITLGKDATDVGEAMYQGLSAGVSEKNIADFTEKMGKLAKGGFTEVATATDIATTVVNAYGKKIEEVDKISDILITTQNRGKTTVDELASAMGRVIPTASSMGLEFEELASAYAISTAKGIATAESTTYIDAMLKELGSTSNGVGKWLKENLNVTFQDLQASGMNLGEILSYIDKEAQNNGTSFKELWSSAEASKMALTLLSDEGTDFTKVLGEMQNSTGATNEAFEKMDSTLKSKAEKSIQKLKNSFISLGETMLPMIEEKIIPSIEKFANWISNLDEETLENIGTWTMWVGGLGVALTVAGKLLTWGSSMVSAIGTLSGALTGATGTVSTFGGGLSGLASLVSPTGLLIGGVVALTGAFVNNQIACKKGSEELQAMGGSVEDFSGRLKTNDSIWTSIFGKEYEFKFSDDFKRAKDTLLEDAQILIEEAYKYNDELNTILSSDVPEEEKQEKLNQYFAAQLETLQKGYTDTLAEDTRNQENRKQAYEQHLIDLGIYNEQEIADRLLTYSEGYVEIQRNVTENEAAIKSIKEMAINEKRELTTAELNEIARLETENGELRSRIAMETGEDIYTAEQQRSLKLKELVDFDVQTHSEADIKKIASIKEYTNNVQEEFNKRKKAIDDDITLTQSEKTSKINALSEQKKALDSFTSNFTSQIETQMQKGQSWDSAFNTATQNYVRYMKESGKSASDTLSTLETMLSNSGADAETWANVIGSATQGISTHFGEVDTKSLQSIGNMIQKMADGGASSKELESAINKIPKDIKPKVTAFIHGKTDADSLKRSIDLIQSKTVNIHTNYTSSGQRPSGYYAKGSEGVLPKRAYGDEYFKNTQTALVGEQGAEIVELPRGAKVKTHRETRNIQRQEGQQPIQVALQVDGRTIANAIAQYLGEAVADNNRKLGYGGAW